MTQEAKKVLYLRLPPESYDALDQEADRQDKSMTTLATEYIFDGLMGGGQKKSALKPTSK